MYQYSAFDINTGSYIISLASYIVHIHHYFTWIYYICVWSLQMEISIHTFSRSSPGKEVILKFVNSCATDRLSLELGFLALGGFIFNVCSLKL